VDRRNQFARITDNYPATQQLIHYAIPDPHVERWMLADPAAFQVVFKRGCTLPAVKCEKDLYKKLLLEEIQKSGVNPPLGGEEYSSDIVERMELGQIGDDSLGRAVRDLRAMIRRWVRR
jgi:hypothetical protein